jgi:hypothetical protein
MFFVGFKISYWSTIKLLLWGFLNYDKPIFERTPKPSGIDCVRLVTSFIKKHTSINIGSSHFPDELDEQLYVGK